MMSLIYMCCVALCLISAVVVYSMQVEMGREFCVCVYMQCVNWYVWELDFDNFEKERAVEWWRIRWWRSRGRSLKHAWPARFAISCSRMPPPYLNVFIRVSSALSLFVWLLILGILESFGCDYLGFFMFSEIWVVVFWLFLIWVWLGLTSLAGFGMWVF